MEEKVQKINWLYLVGYVLGPAVICAICYALSAAFFPKGNMAVILLMVPTILAVVWWIFAGSLIFRKKSKELEQKFESEGYTRNQIFYAKGQTVMLDVKKGMLGINFFWNPFKSYIISAKKVKDVKVDDGKHGSGFMEGSSQVSFLFTVDDVRVRVYTFRSNQRFRMDDKYILTGISKADVMLKSLNEARANAK